MAIITLYTRNEESGNFDDVIIHHQGSVISWVLENINPGENFQVFDGGLSKDNEISRNEERMLSADVVSIFIVPSGASLVPLLISLVVSVAVSILAKQDAPGNVNRTQQSPNNSLSDRRNVARPNQRIVDIVGKVKSIPDVIQREYARYVDNIEHRYGYYCVARNKVSIDDVRDGDALMSDTLGASAGIYYPGNSPNNSAPDIQIGDAINQEVVGVYQSNDAIGQSIKRDDEQLIIPSRNTRAYNAGYFVSNTINFSEIFSAGDDVELLGFSVDDPLAETPTEYPFGGLTSKVLSVSGSTITFDITLDPSWATFPDGNFVEPYFRVPSIVRLEPAISGPYTISSTKINTLLVNIHAPSGMYKQSGSSKPEPALVEFSIIYQKLDDNLDPVGPETTVTNSIVGVDRDEKGVTTEIDLGAATFVTYSLTRITPTDFEFSGTVVDDIKLKDAFGLYDVGVTDFGNVTTIQTKRTTTAQTTAIKEPELNCIATELVYKYENGVFDTVLTENTQAMQSLIRLALDPYIGRREASELDLDGLISSQTECEDYFSLAAAGQCSYSFDSTNISAQETFFLLSNAIFCTIWREGRVLKSWFERPQSVPNMVFTHRSKQPNSETWVREFAQSKRKDSIEFKYTDDQLYTQETLYYPVDRSGTNPLTVEIPGIKGVQQATWRMMREYNKLVYKEVTVDFTATEEGRLVLPQRLISVVKGSRVGSYDGYIVAVDGLAVTLSQDVTFTQGDDHFIILKRRDGTVESIPVTETNNARIVNMLFIPTEAIYAGNDALKTEFSFGNEARLDAQLMLPQEISPSSRQYVGIKAINYSDKYYQDDPINNVLGAFSNGFSSGFR